MYLAEPPVPTTKVRKVVVLEGTETDAEAVIDEAFYGGAVNIDASGEFGDTFHVIIVGEPGVVCEMTEEVLRQHIKKQIPALA